MLTRIERISDMAVFRDFRWSSLEDFGTHNLIFGANGSGKTTISNALRSIGYTSPDLGKLRLAFSDGTKLDLSDGTQSPHPFSVFNAAYVSENLLYQQGATAQTLYYIGAESATARKELDAAEEKLGSQKAEAAKMSSKARAATGTLNTFGTGTARLVRTTLTALGDTRYAKFERPQYFQAAKALAKRGSDEIEKLAALDRNSLTARASAPAMTIQPRLTDPFAKAQQLAVDVEAALNRRLNLQGVLDILENPEMTQWLEQGTGFHRDTSYAECLFCGRLDFPSARRELLERAFSLAYSEFQASMSSQIRALSQQAERCRELTIPDEGLIYGDLRTDYQASAGLLVDSVDAFRTWLGKAQEMLEHHRQEPSGDPEPLPDPPSNGTGAIEVLSQFITTHNERCANIQEDRNDAGKALEDSLVAESLSEYNRLTRTVFTTKVSVDLGATMLRATDTEVREWRGRLRDSIGAARGLESDIHHYLGHGELEILVNADDSAFVITREGRPAVGLSEGEQTAIALLYFLRSLDHDDGARRQERIVVLDDPVSSLDGNSLLAASEYIRQRTQGIRQLFVLTHNDQLFLDTLRWMKSEDRKDGKRVRAYMLSVTHTSGGRSSQLVPIDPMLEKYRSMYMFAFAEMYRYRRSTSGDFAGDLYRLPNLARRFLETFCLHRYPSIRAGLGVAKSEFAKEGLGDVMANRLVNLLNVESHGIEERDTGLGLARFEELRNVVGDVLRLVQLVDERHYAALEKIILTHNPTLKVT